jgi:hypothetical protein
MRKIFTAWSGRRIYLKLRKKLGFTSNDIVLFFPENDPKEIEAAISYVPAFIEKTRIDGVYCIWTGSAYSCPHVKESVVISEKESRRLLDFYDLYNFNRNLLVVSLRLPWGRLAYRLENYKGVSRADLYRYQVFFGMERSR